MLSTFPTPVLSVAADAVRELEGREALSGLWTLFTKCKESIQDGRRLENISWRLWYREMAAASSYRPPTPDSESCQLSEESCFFVESSKREHATHTSSAGAHHPASMPPRARFLNSSSNSTVISVGKIICDILPQQILPTRPSTASITSLKGYLPSPTLEGPHCPQDTLLTSTVHIVESEVLESKQQDVPSVCLPCTPPDSAFPRLVVVNPTPNLTPHPTPPATPTMQTTIPAYVLASSTHLLPPPPPTVLMATVPSSPTTQISEPPQTGPPSHSRKPESTETTIKASDRRFFLHQSPDGESPNERGTQGDVASSQGSSQLLVKESVESKRSTTRPRRVKEVKGKEPLQRLPMRPNKMQTGRPPQLRRAATSDGRSRPTFNIGSTSSNGSKVTETSKSGSKGSGEKQPIEVKESILLKSAVSSLPKERGAPPNRRQIVLSSEYETTDTEDGDDSWASDDVAVESAKVKEVGLREAALEAQRQTDLFTKIPKRSYSNLNRTQSGLLSQLLNPNPAIFPPNHPYRSSYSSHDVAQAPRMSVYAPPPGLHTSKSVAAVPLAAQVTAQSINGESSMAHASNGKAKARAPATGPYRPKGRPQGEEMEDDSDSGDENASDVIQVSRSIAQQKLAVLAGRRTSDRSPFTQRAPPPVRRSVTTAPSPIPLGHPYNLPLPAPPSTPRTTRRQMLSTEMSESLRRNLLWERQVSKINVTSGARRRSSGALGSGARPLTSTTSIVQVSTRGADPNKRGDASQNGAERDHHDDPRRHTLLRNYNSADNFHYAGW